MRFIYRAADKSYAIMRGNALIGHIDWHRGWYFFPEPDSKFDAEELKRITTKLEELNSP